MKNISYKTKGTCSREIKITIDDSGTITECRFVGGCQGNTSGISKLVVGMKADDVAKLLRGTDCGGKGTSCPDQLALAIEQNR